MLVKPRARKGSPFPAKDLSQLFGINETLLLFGNEVEDSLHLFGNDNEDSLQLFGINEIEDSSHLFGNEIEDSLLHLFGNEYDDSEPLPKNAVGRYKDEKMHVDMINSSIIRKKENAAMRYFVFKMDFISLIHSFRLLCLKFLRSSSFNEDVDSIWSRLFKLFSSKIDFELMILIGSISSRMPSRTNLILLFTQIPG